MTCLSLILNWVKLITVMPTECGWCYYTGWNIREKRRKTFSPGILFFTSWQTQCCLLCPKPSCLPHCTETLKYSTETTPVKVLSAPCHNEKTVELHNGPLFSATGIEEKEKTSCKRVSIWTKYDLIQQANFKIYLRQLTKLKLNIKY